MRNAIHITGGGRLSELFSKLNESGLDYIVLRNYENLLDSGGEYCLEKDLKGDIDFLCTDRKKFVKLLGAKKRGKGLNDSHYEIFLEGKKIEIDVREVGDGYYCEEWEKSLLFKRVFFSGKFYVMDGENYFFSLIYHCVIHKGYISAEYLKKINSVFKTEKSESLLKKELFDFMRLKNYKVTNSSDWELNTHFGNCTSEFYEKNMFWSVKRFLLRNIKKIWQNHKFLK
ncbi:MAG: hypothetical protein IJ530_03700 [Treponema sp.]|uniref:hypothetical protein n=1 Tax=Treponema sp. TaxID=166 RepID=UPI0025DB92BE|nr:hypothetical protein [Treponema sp.]MBQ8678848.1 hypothetical protein [Treponema sp.]